MKWFWLSLSQLIIFFTPFSLRAQQKSWKHSLEVGAGYDNNLFRSPEIYCTVWNGDTTCFSPVVADPYLYLQMRERWKWSASPQWKWSVRILGMVRQFWSYPEASEYEFRTKGKGVWSPTSQVRFSLTGEGRYAHTRLFNILGQGLTRVFVFQEWIITHEQKWFLRGRTLELNPAVQFRWRDYQEVPGRFSLDNRRWILQVAIRWNFSRILAVWGSVYYQNRYYPGYPARNRLGRRLPDAPPRTYFYWRGMMGVDAETAIFSFGVKGYWERRQDNFEQWYAFTEWGILAELSWDLFSQRVQLGLSGGIRYRVYWQKQGITRDGAHPPLVWSRTFYRPELYIWFHPNWAVYARVQRLERETNVEIPFRRTNRPYEVWIYEGGIQWAIQRVHRKPGRFQ